MQRRVVLLFALLLIFAACVADCAEKSKTLAGLSALELSRRLDRLYRSDTSHGFMTMKVKTADYERSLKMEVWSRGMDDTLMRIISPPKEEGTSTLKKGREMWNYLPKIDKTIRIPPSMMMSSWMGSDFTNDDLMRETSWETDYEVSFAQDPPSGQIGLVYIPKEGAPVTWSKVVGYMLADSLLPVSMEYYDEKGRKVRVMNFHDIGVLGGRTLPKRMTLTPLSEDKVGNFTEVVYGEMSFDVKLDPETFSLASLRKAR
jgi:outer membrane lipoprotein-sorting protein